MTLKINELLRINRLIIMFIAVLAPLLLLKQRIFGSFLFSFSIPIIWQISYLNKPFSSLGFTRKALIPSIIYGIISGGTLGFFGGKILQFFNLTNNTVGNNQIIRIGFGVFKMEFPLAKELGYQLLIKSNGFGGFIIYLIFSIFVIGLGEEIFWRGFIQQKIADKTRTYLAINITALLFALSHFYMFTLLPLIQTIIFLSLIYIVGLIWGFLYERTRNIFSVAISHGITAFIIWKYYFFSFTGASV